MKSVLFSDITDLDIKLMRSVAGILVLGRI